MLSVVAVGTAGADHETSDEWEGSFDPAAHSTVVTYAWSVLRDNTYRCDTPAGCIWTDYSAHAHGDTRVRHCEFLGANQVTLAGNCSDSTPTGWTLTQSTLTHHDPPTWSLRFCTQPGWGQNPDYSAWGTTDGPINDTGHRARLDSPPLPSMWGPLPSATAVNEPPFCGVWVPTTPTVNISGATVVEGESAVLSVVAGSGFDGGSGSVSFQTVDGSATAPSDFLDPGASTLTFAGPGTRTVIVPTIDDDVVEEDSETFTVQLFGESGVEIGVGTATVTIIDNDDDDAPCPAGQTGTPPNCVPIVVSTGCGVPPARLSALTVTAGGSSVLSGFSSTTYSYAVTVDGASAGFTATAADAAAVVRIGSGSASTGSASSTQYVAEGGSVDIEVVVTSGDDSCTYTVTVNRPSAGLTDCPAMSGQELVNGVCVDACSGSDTIPQFDSEGQVTGCLFVGDCPYDLYGLSGPPANPYRVWSAVWPRDSSEIDPVSPGLPVTETRTAVKCADLWRIDPTYWPEWPHFHSCVWAETNLESGVGDCLNISMSVEAVIPAVEADSQHDNWSFRSPTCGNQSAPRVASTTDPVDGR